MVTDWDENFVELQWEQPKTDGGSPVTEFTVQKKERGSPYWVNAATVPGRDTKVHRRAFVIRRFFLFSTVVPEFQTKISDLVKGQEYEFRVIATNKAGQSPPSEPSDPITVNNRYRKRRSVLLLLLAKPLAPVVAPSSNRDILYLTSETENQNSSERHFHKSRDGAARGHRFRRRTAARSDVDGKRFGPETGQPDDHHVYRLPHHHEQGELETGRLRAVQFVAEKRVWHRRRVLQRDRTG